MSEPFNSSLYLGKIAWHPIYDYGVISQCEGSQCTLSYFQHTKDHQRIHKEQVLPLNELWIDSYSIRQHI